SSSGGLVPRETTATRVEQGRHAFPKEKRRRKAARVARARRETRITTSGQRLRLRTKNLWLAHQDHNQDNQDDQAAARVIPPAGAVRPGWQSADQEEHQQD